MNTGTIHWDSRTFVDGQMFEPLHLYHPQLKKLEDSSISDWIQVKVRVSVAAYRQLNRTPGTDVYLLEKITPVLSDYLQKKGLTIAMNNIFKMDWNSSPEDEFFATLYVIPSRSRRFHVAQLNHLIHRMPLSFNPASV